MTQYSFASLLDRGIRVLLYILIFWLPYSPSVVEFCVIAASALWIVKRGLRWRSPEGRSLKAFIPEGGPLTHPILAFWLACLCSCFTGAFWSQSFPGLFTKISEWFVVYFLVLEVFRERRQFVVAFSILFFTAAATAFDGFLQAYVLGKDIFFGQAMVDGKRITAGFNHPNSLGAFLAVVLVMFSGVWPVLRSRVGRSLFWGLWGMLGWALVLTFSQGAWAGFFCGLVLWAGGRWALRMRGERRRKFILAAILILIAAFGLLGAWTGFQGIFDPWRVGVWRDCLRMLADSPVWGHGPNTFMMIFQEYRAEETAAGPFWSPTYAHNSFLQLAVETGLVGLGTFLFIIFQIFRTVLSGLMRARDPHQESSVLLGILGGVLAFLVQSAVDTHFYSLQLSVLLWLVIGLTISLDKLLREPGNCGIK